MIWNEFGGIPVLNLVILAETLLLFGIFYNFVVGWLMKKGFTEGYMAFIVALGVFVVLAGVAFLSWQTAAICLMAFTFAGIPMIFGSVWRYIRSREQDQVEIRKAG